MLTLLLLVFFHAPAPTSNIETSHGTFTFNIVDTQGDPIPARLTFVDEGGSSHNLFPNANADPTKLAVRKHVVYTLEGSGEITVPVGSWDIYASHGIEWSIDSTHLDIVDGGSYAWTATLTHEIDTTDWISADFHLHTLTHSGHGDSNMNERIISIIGEGLEFVVATDHNHNTDYQPTIDDLRANEHLTAVVGNEVSTNYGHLNIFPLDADAKVVNQSLKAPHLFTMIRAEQNQYGVMPIIQINHPRWGGIDFFGKQKLDPVTGESDSEHWTWDFDSIEVLNENEGWGFHDAEITNINTEAGKHSILRDWFNMLNAGRKIAAVGNSDSHTVIANIAGIPRNYVYIENDDASNIDPAAVADAIRNGRVFTTTGPFLRMTANGYPMGSTISIHEPFVDIHLDVQVASWIDLNSMKIIKNGDEVALITIDQAIEGVKHFRPKIRIDIQHDCWIIAIAQGNKPMAPYMLDKARPVYPLAITNPIYIDADGDGKWTPPTQWTRTAIRHANGNVESLVTLFNELNATEASLLVLASANDPRIAKQMISLGLTSKDRVVKLAACRAAEELGDATLLPYLSALIDHPESDRYLGFSAWAACDALNAQQGELLLDRHNDRFGWSNTRRFASEHALRLAGDFIRGWQIGGYFAAPEMEYLTHVQSPEPNIVHIVAPKTVTGEPLEWKDATTNANGYLDLALNPVTNKTIAYARSWIWSAAQREVDFTIGSDDGCRIWIGDALVWDDQSKQSAYADHKRGTMTLQQGWNSILVKIINNTKGMGFFFRVLDDDVKYTSKQPKL